MNIICYNKNDYKFKLFVKYLYYIPTLFFCLNCESQLNYNFENGLPENLEQYPKGRWNITNENKIEGSYSLHHTYDNPESGIDAISLKYTNALDFNSQITWSFRICYDYNPSSANNWAVYLSSDLPSFEMSSTGKASGIVVGVNFIGNDDLLKIWKVENGKLTQIIATSTNYEEVIADSSALIKVIYQPSGDWEIYISADGDERHLKLAGSNSLAVNYQSNYFGLCYKYSSQQDRKLWIDDIRIVCNFVNDIESPIIDTAYFINNKTISLEFNEPIAQSIISKTNFKFSDEYLAIDFFEFSDVNKITLHLLKPVKQESTIWITVTDIQDIRGNFIQTIDIGLIYYTHKPFDLLITEIMADPDPQIGLPNCEYIELYNNSKYPVNIGDWKLFNNTSYISLSKNTLNPGRFYLLCQKGKSYLLEKYGNVIETWTSEYFLSNSSTVISLHDTSNTVISFANYNSNLFNNNYKKEGGWSLEMVDIYNPCDTKLNWRASENISGGTPGSSNSFSEEIPDNENPEQLHVLVPNDSIFQFVFSEPIHPDIVSNTSNIYVDNSVGKPKSVKYSPLNYNTLELLFANKFQEGKEYSINLNSNICDCVGNQIVNNEKIHFKLPAQTNYHKILINELLFNASENGGEFIELYNNSDQIIDAGKLLIAVIDKSTDKITNYCKVAEQGFLFFPGQYLAISKNVQNLSSLFNIKNKKTVIENSNLPAIPDDDGAIEILDISLQPIDIFSYSQNMQFTMLDRDKDISLERLSFERNTSDVSNWHSASKGAGYATPGYENSQTQMNKLSEKIISIWPEVFTPNNDGIDDVLSVKIKPTEPNTQITIKIFDSSGVLVKDIATNNYAGSVNEFSWNGTSNEGKVIQQGIYIIYAIVLSTNGTKKEFKKACVVGIK